MRILRLSKEQKYERLVEKEYKWHKKFAWLPVTFEIETGVATVWLEFYGRKMNLSRSDYWNRSYSSYTYCLKEDVLANALKDPHQDISKLLG